MIQLSEEEKRKYCEQMGANLKRLRRIGGMTQNDLAERSGISRERISRMESGSVVMRWAQFNSFLMVFTSIGPTKDYLVASGILSPRVLQAMQGKDAHMIPDIDVPVSSSLSREFYDSFQLSRSNSVQKSGG